MSLSFSENNIVIRQIIDYEFLISLMNIIDKKILEIFLFILSHNIPNQIKVENVIFD